MYPLLGQVSQGILVVLFIAGLIYCATHWKLLF